MGWREAGGGGRASGGGGGRVAGARRARPPRPPARTTTPPPIYASPSSHFGGKTNATVCQQPFLRQYFPTVGVDTPFQPFKTAQLDWEPHGHAPNGERGGREVVGRVRGCAEPSCPPTP